MLSKCTASLWIGHAVSAVTAPNCPLPTYFSIPRNERPPTAIPFLLTSISRHSMQEWDPILCLGLTLQPEHRHLEERKVVCRCPWRSDLALVDVDDIEANNKNEDKSIKK